VVGSFSILLTVLTTAVHAYAVVCCCVSQFSCFVVAVAVVVAVVADDGVLFLEDVCFELHQQQQHQQP
jgi:hypothetical protein